MNDTTIQKSCSRPAGRLLLVKYGGHAMDDAELNRVFVDNMAELAGDGYRPVLVHGGGPQITQMLDRLNIKSEFRRGLRVTDAAAMDVVEMMLCGLVNKHVVSLFMERGVKAVGLSGKDAGLLQGQPLDPSFGQTGEVTRVDPGIVSVLLEAGYLPVVAPVAIGPSGMSLNVNADIAASALAGALEADCFMLVTDVPGVLDATGTLMPHLTAEEAQQLIKDGVITGGMIPKVESCLTALERGCRNAVILDGRRAGTLKAYLTNGATCAVGTTIGPRAS